MSAGSVIGEILIGAARGAMELREDLDEAGRAKLDAAIDQVRGILDGIPVRTGPGGTWTEDTERRLEGGGAGVEAVAARAKLEAVEQLYDRLSADGGRNSPRAILRTYMRELRDGPQPPPQPYPEPGES